MTQDEITQQMIKLAELHTLQGVYRLLELAKEDPAAVRGIRMSLKKRIERLGAP